MDLSLSEEQTLIRESARDFLENECPEEHVRAMEEDEAGYSPDLWKKMADLGWQGLMIPEENGGSGFTYLDLCVLVEEFGRALVPGPFIPNATCAAWLVIGGSDGQKAKYLPGIASGTAIHTYAVTEETGRWDRGGYTLTATQRATTTSSTVPSSLSRMPTWPTTFTSSPTRPMASSPTSSSRATRPAWRSTSSRPSPATSRPRSSSTTSA